MTNDTITKQEKGSNKLHKWALQEEEDEHKIQNVATQFAQILTIANL